MALRIWLKIGPLGSPSRPSRITPALSPTVDPRWLTAILDRGSNPGCRLTAKPEVDARRRDGPNSASGTRGIYEMSCSLGADSSRVNKALKHQECHWKLAFAHSIPQ